MAIKVLDFDLVRAPECLHVPERYRLALVLLRWAGRPLGHLTVEVNDGGEISWAAIWEAAAEAFGPRLSQAVLEDLLPRSLVASSPAPLPSGSVVICTRDRPEELRRCLDSICPATGSDVEVIVVDNAPPDDRTSRLVAEYPARYVLEPRRGLNAARGCGARAATGEIVLYTDDDVIVDPGWFDALRRPFADPRVAGVTGLVVPAELETEAQEQFERFVGFGRGFERREFSAARIAPVAASRVGAGASMAFRREQILRLGLFDAELDCGTAARSGGDHYAFYRLLRLGHALVYEPTALAWHRHRRTPEGLRSQLYDYSVGVNCWLLRALVDHGEGQAIVTSFAWFLKHHLFQLWCGLWRRAEAQPLSLTLAEIRGFLAAPLAFRASRRAERAAVCRESGTIRLSPGAE